MIETGDGWAITLDKDITVEQAGKFLESALNMLVDHPNFTPLEVQSVVMGAVLGASGS